MSAASQGRLAAAGPVVDTIQNTWHGMCVARTHSAYVCVWVPKEQSISATTGISHYIPRQWTAHSNRSIGGNVSGTNQLVNATLSLASVHYLSRPLHLVPAAAVNPRAYEYTIVSYFLLPTALLRVPMLGSLVAFPGAALGAYCLGDILSRNPHAREAFDHL